MLDQSPLRSAWNRSVGLGLGIVTLPLLAASYVLAAIDNKSLMPIYTQYRHGQYGQDTKIHKLKTMKDPDLDLIKEIKEEGDFDKVRITPIGNLVRIFKGDELLQLWENVIFKGDENLVGPRLLSKSGHSPALLYDPKREAEPPGLICLDTVRNGSNVCDETRKQDDLEYIENRSLVMDWGIVCATAIVIPKQIVQALFCGEKSYNTQRAAVLAEEQLAVSEFAP